MPDVELQNQGRAESRRPALAREQVRSSSSRIQCSTSSSRSTRTTTLCRDLRLTIAREDQQGSGNGRRRHFLDLARALPEALPTAPTATTCKRRLQKSKRSFAERGSLAEMSVAEGEHPPSGRPGHLAHIAESVLVAAVPRGSQARRFGAHIGCLCVSWARRPGTFRSAPIGAFFSATERHSDASVSRASPRLLWWPVPAGDARSPTSLRAEGCVVSREPKPSSPALIASAAAA